MLLTGLLLIIIAVFLGWIFRDQIKDILNYGLEKVKENVNDLFN